LRGEGQDVQGLTTAAGIWGVGGVGLAVGAGAYRLALTAAILIALILAAGRVLKVDERLRQRERALRDAERR
jgi:putative Mg2+ transporter-C (MgtC) family protein